MLGRNDRCRGPLQNGSSPFVRFFAWSVVDPIGLAVDPMGGTSNWMDSRPHRIGPYYRQPTRRQNVETDSIGCDLRRGALKNLEFGWEGGRRKCDDFAVGLDIDRLDLRSKPLILVLTIM